MNEAGRQRQTEAPRPHLRLVKDERARADEGERSELSQQLNDAVDAGQWDRALPLAQKWLECGHTVDAASAWESKTQALPSHSAFNRWFDAYRRQGHDAEVNLRRVLRVSRDANVRLLAAQYMSELAELGAQPAGREDATQEETDWYASTAVRILEELSREGRDEVLADLAEAQTTQLKNFVNHSKVVKDVDVSRLIDKSLATATKALHVDRPGAREHYEEISRRVEDYRRP